MIETCLLLVGVALILYHFIHGHLQVRNDAVMIEMQIIQKLADLKTKDPQKSNRV